MIRILFLMSAMAVPAVYSIIVKDPPPSGLEYKYSYNIDDPTTGDSKSQQESRNGDVVTGSYSVVDPDGTKRTVEYTADSKRGFNAVVRTEPTGQVYAPEKNTIETDYQYAQGQQKVYEAQQPIQYQIPQQYQPVQQLQYQPQQVPQYVQQAQYEPASQPVQYSSSPLYTKTSYQQEPQNVYFTPSNEIGPEENAFHNGQYFLPAQ